MFNTGLPARSQLGHTLYNPSQSTTVTGMNGSSFEITYGDGSFASGPVVSDVVDIGGATVNEQAIGIPTNVSESFTRDVHSNGLVGLGFSKINTIRPEQQKTFFDNILPDLSQPVFTASLKSGVVGAYEFGNIDATQFQGEITTVPVDNSRGFWEFGSAKFAIGDGAIQTVSTGPGTAIADTGTSLILMDDEVVQAYYGEVAGANLDLRVGGFVFPCDEPLPDLRVAVGDSYMATVSGKLMNFAKAGPDSRTGDPGSSSLLLKGGFPLTLEKPALVDCNRTKTQISKFLEMSSSNHNLWFLMEPNLLRWVWHLMYDNCLFFATEIIFLSSYRCSIRFVWSPSVKPSRQALLTVV